MYERHMRDGATRMRSEGKTYLEICQALKIEIPKSTMSSWFRGLQLSKAAQARITRLQAKGLAIGRHKSMLRSVQLRLGREDEFRKRNQRVCEHLQHDTRLQKAVLAILYLAEGSKSKRGSLMFGNSDPDIIRLFLALLRACFSVDEGRLRITVQCRADQNVKVLQAFWSSITSVPLHNFYKPQIDRRTIGKRTLKKDYKGVCRIDYFVSLVDLELKSLAKQIEQIQYK